MELAYLDAFNVTTFVLLHHLTFGDLQQRTTGVPPLLLASQCNSSGQWRIVIEDIRKLVRGLKEMSETIFLSYARQDRRLLGAVRRALRKQGIVRANDVVIVRPHQSVKPGVTNVRKTIKEQISSASKVVMIATDHSANSMWVNYEVGMAAALEKPLVVVGKKGSGKTASMLKAFGKAQSIEIEEAGVTLA